MNQGNCRAQLKSFGRQVTAYNEIMVAVLLLKHNDGVKVDGNIKVKIIFNDELMEKIDNFRSALKSWHASGLRLNYLLYAVIKGWEVLFVLQRNPGQVDDFFRYGEMGRFFVTVKIMTTFFSVIDSEPISDTYPNGTLASSNLEYVYYLHITQLLFMLVIKLWNLKMDDTVEYNFLYRQVPSVKVFDETKLTFLNNTGRVWGDVNISKLDRAFFKMQDYSQHAFAEIDF